MKALSIKQPYAELILQGRKKIELRKWNTNFRGEFLIHASLNSDKLAMEKFKFVDLPVGCVLGKVTLVDVKKYNSEKEHSSDNDFHLASRYWGDYGFVLRNPVRLEKPLFCKGKLNFWVVDEKF